MRLSRLSLPASRRATVQVTVEPARVEIADGAVQVKVEPAEVRIEEGAVQSNVTVEPARVDIHEGAVQVDAPVTVEQAQVDVHVPAPAKSRKATAKRGKDGEIEVTYHDDEEKEN